MMNPCKDCPDRHRACWDSCDKYKQFKMEIQKVKDDNKQRRLVDDVLFQGAQRCRQKKKRRKSPNKTWER